MYECTDTHQFHNYEKDSSLLDKHLHLDTLLDPGITQETLCCNYNDEGKISGLGGLGCDYKGIAWEDCFCLFICLILLFCILFMIVIIQIYKIYRMLYNKSIVLKIKVVATKCLLNGYLVKLANTPIHPSLGPVLVTIHSEISRKLAMISHPHPIFQSGWQ